jgi:hypothetical protein
LAFPICITFIFALHSISNYCYYYVFHALFQINSDHNIDGLMSCLRCLCLLTCGGFQRIIVLCFCFVFRRSVSPVLLVSLNCPFFLNLE